MPHVSFTDVQKSLLSGDPVIMYSAPDALYQTTNGGPSPKHIFVLTGYNQSNSTYDVMSPNIPADIFNGVLSNKGKPAGQLLTADYLTSKTVNDDNATDASPPGYGGHMFMIRKKYVSATTP